MKTDFDADGDGTITSTDLTQADRMLKIENEDKKQDAQRKMAWFALCGMLIYPLVVLLASFFNLPQAAEILGEMASVYFVSVAAIVAAFFGTQALTSKSGPY